MGTDYEAKGRLQLVTLVGGGELNGFGCQVDMISNSKVSDETFFDRIRPEHCECLLADEGTCFSQDTTGW